MACLQRAGSANGLSRACSGSLPPAAPCPRLQRRGSKPSPLSRAGSACAALPEGNPTQSSGSAPSVDPFTAAGRRLQTLLSRVGDGEDELLDSLVEAEAPESKLQTSVVIGGVVTVGAVIVTSLLGKDPWGGAGLNAATLAAVGTGLAAALPLAALRMWSWTPAAAQAVPALQDVHDGQLELQKPWLSSMSRPQVGVMLALEVLPLTLLLFPAGQAGIMAAVGMYGQMLSGAGLQGQDTYLAALALVLTALGCGVGRSLDLSVSAEEYDLVATASKNADRYYRTMAADVHTSPAEAARAAEAFRFVAAAWLQTRGEAALLAGAITAADVLAQGGLWYGTGNLAAPAIAALAVNGVDYWHMHTAVLKRERRLTGGTGGSGSA
ncbi:hypothetical protein HYH02_010552 [Chlamydomonas schloesseri]|uniref:Uncharacterized protein n=1 Tax=Chlamydomonas schloesseri TaxID=2026947 RepID=A0A835TL22_9CHLO|nr:hypothetical protein HYH02_010552 [Chlamydomonas schloesseri]|eukprot:KAG2439670.1 hypothetical protein HYH02_010552 [Chlamydomonas schloesseri]